MPRDPCLWQPSLACSSSTWMFASSQHPRCTWGWVPRPLAWLCAWEPCIYAQPREASQPLRVSLPGTGLSVPSGPGRPLCSPGAAWALGAPGCRTTHCGHTSRQEVQAALRARAGLLHARYHRFLAWFICLLLASPPPVWPPGAWVPALPAVLRGQAGCVLGLLGHRPVPCASLPVQEDGACVFLGLAAGNSSATSMEGKLRHRVTVSSPGEPGWP